MHDVQEPSYYEIALTNRQVLVAFVLILGSILGAFLSGVWLGKGGGSTVHAQEMQLAQGGEGENLEDFRFFEENGRADGLDKPDLSRLLDKPNQKTTLAEDVGSQKRNPGRRRGQQAQRQTPPAKTRPAPAQPPAKARPQPAKTPPAKTPPAQAPPPPAKTQPAPARPAETPPATTTAEDGFIVQVFSSHDQNQAQKVRGQLQTAGFNAFVSPLDRADGPMFRVRIGPFPDRGQAKQAAGRIKSKFDLDTWVTAASN